ncbi:MAG: 30S ribosomal protein S17 [Desulfatiglandales bacterium]
METRGNRKKLIGVVVGRKMDKTASVLVERLVLHGKYKKYVRRRKKYLVHDPLNQSQVGDKVKIIESRPISKRKRWQLLEILARGAVVQ